MTISPTFLDIAQKRADGPVSVKDNSTLTISAAGTISASIAQTAFLDLSLPTLRRIELNDDVMSNILSAREAGQTLLPPGVETLIHAMLPATYVLHTRSPKIAGLLAGVEGSSQCADLFGAAALWVPAVPPTIRLVRTVQDMLSQAGSTSQAYAIFMQNHGLLVIGNSPEEIEQRYSEIETTIDKRISRNPDTGATKQDTHDLGELNEAVRRALADTRAAHGMALSPSLTSACSNLEILRRAATHQSFLPIATSLMSSHIADLGRALCYVPRHSDLTSPQALQADVLHEVHDFWNRYDAAPRVVVVEKSGAVIIGESDEELQRTCVAFNAALETACYAESFGGAQPIPADYFEALMPGP